MTKYEEINKRIDGIVEKINDIDERVEGLSKLHDRMNALSQFVTDYIMMTFELPKVQDQSDDDINIKETGEIV